MKRRDRTERCLTDEEIASYVDGAVESDLRGRIEDHLVRCSICLHNVGELKQLAGSETVLSARLPRAALARAEEMVAQHAQAAPRFDLTLALKGGMCRLLETTGDLLLPGRFAPVPVRGGKSPAADAGAGADTPSLRVAKSLSGYLVTLDMVAEKHAVLAKLTIVEEASAERPDGVKAKLYSPGASETRYSRRGKVRFSALRPGVYGIDIEEIGRIKLDIQ